MLWVLKKKIHKELATIVSYRKIYNIVFSFAFMTQQTVQIVYTSNCDVLFIIIIMHEGLIFCLFKDSGYDFECIISIKWHCSIK